MKPKSLLINGKKVSYFDEGSGFPILIIQGWVVCKDAYVPLMNCLKKKYRIVIPDLPGHGDSEELDEKNSLENYLKVLNSFVEKLKLKKFHVLGTSLGGTLAFLYVLQKKEDVDKLVLQAPVFSWKQLPGGFAKFYLKPIVKFLSKFKTVQNKYHDAFRKYALETRLPRIKNHVSKKEWKEVNDTIKIVMEKFDNNLSRKASTEFGASALDTDLTKRVDEIQNKTLILWGSEDSTLDKKQGLKLKELIPNSKYVEINGTHDVVVENYLDICREIKKFLG